MTLFCVAPRALSLSLGLCSQPTLLLLAGLLRGSLRLPALSLSSRLFLLLGLLRQFELADECRNLLLDVIVCVWFLVYFLLPKENEM